MSLEEGLEALKACEDSHDWGWLTVLASRLFAATEPATPAAIAASTTNRTSAIP